ncbi:MAG: hypothetical protein IKY96_07600 [Oscillospiraceae bacterium]|nr:hypothetical protein [Oscillospiraceae bacterium]
MADGSLLDRVTDFAMEHPDGFSAAVIATEIAAIALTTYMEARRENRENVTISQADAQLQAEREEKEAAVEERRKQVMTADAYFAEAEAILSELLRQPRLNQVAEDYPKTLERLREDIQREKERAGESTAKGAAMFLYQRALDLQGEYDEFAHKWETAKKQWELWHQLLEEKFQDSRTLRIPIEDGVEFLEIDCDFWCTDALERASRELEPLEQPQESTIRDFNTLSEQAETLSARIDQIVVRALANFESAEQRVMISEVIINALERRGWRETDYRFSSDGDDNERLNELILTMENPVEDKLKFVFRRGDPQTTYPESPVENLMEVTLELKGIYTRESQQTLMYNILMALAENNIDVRNIAQNVRGVPE